MLISQTVKLRARQLSAVIWKNMKIYYLEPPVLIFGILFPFFIFLAFALGKDISIGELVPGLLAISFFFTGSSVGPYITPWETRTRTLERLLATPASPSILIIGDIFSGAIFGLFVSGIVLLIGTAGLGAQIANSSMLILTIGLSAVAFGALGAIFSALPTDKPSNVMMLSNLVRLPLIFISGVFVPLAALPAWGRWISYISPVTYVTDLMRLSFGEPHFFATAINLAVLTAFTALLVTAALYLHNKTIYQRI